MKFITIIFLIYSLCAFTQNVNNVNGSLKSELVPYRKGIKWGYANRKMEIVIETKYTYADLFNEYNLGLVATGGPNHAERNYGYVSEHGEEIIPTSKYNFISEFKDSMAVFQTKRNDSIIYGVVNIHGKELFSGTYNSLELLGNGIIKFGTYQLVEGMAIRKYGLLNKNCDTIVHPDLVNYYPFINGYSVVSKQSEHQNGLINQIGEIVIPLEYEYVFLKDRREPFRNHNNNKYIKGDLIPVYKNRKWGFINYEGEVIIPLNFERVSYFYEGISRAQLNTENGKKYGLVNRKGKIIVPFEYDYIGEFDSGLCPVRKVNKAGYINKKGETVIQLQYDLTGTFNEGIAKVGNKTNGKFADNWGLIDSTGKEIIPLQYDRIDDFQYDITRVVKNGKSGCINKQGEIVIPIEYNELGVFENFILVVNSKGQSTIFDHNNTQLFPFSETIILPAPNHPNLFLIPRYPYLAGEFDYIDIEGNKYFED